MDAGYAAGFDKVYIVTEPVATALDSVHKSPHHDNESKNIVVFDFGGGAVDVIDDRLVNIKSLFIRLSTATPLLVKNVSKKPQEVDSI